MITILGIPGLAGYRLTTRHSSSRYGIPVVERISTGEVVDPQEIITNGMEEFSAAHMVLEAVAYRTDPEADLQWSETEVAFAERYLSEAMRVLDLPSAGKVPALNAGDAVAVGYPRIYLDADIVIPAIGVRALRDASHFPARPTSRAC